MGNPMSPILSDIVMDALFDKCLPLLKFTPTFLYKYVDDVITDVPLDMIDNALQIFNNFHERISFTTEVEDIDNSVPFLDMRVIRKDGHILIDWYRKPTSTSRILHFHSQHPMSMKRNVAFNLIKRCLDLSHQRFHTKNITKASNILRLNNYPDELIKKTIHKVKQIINNPRIMTSNEQEPESYCALKYIPHLTENLKKHLQGINVKIAMEPINKLNQIYTKTKDPIEKEDKSNVVYKINCKSPCNKCYIGQTSKKLAKRMYQHKNEYKNILIENSDKRNNKTVKQKSEIDLTKLKYKKPSGPKKSGNTGLISHGLEMFKKGCPSHFDFDNVTILTTNHKIKSKREFIEATEILKHENNINIKTDLRKVSNVYFPTLKNYFATKRK